MPGDTRTHLARLARRDRSRAGDVAELKARVWRAVDAAEAVLTDAAADADAALVLRAVHALTQAAGTYARILETGEMEARLADLEARLEEFTNRRAAA